MAGRAGGPRSSRRAVGTRAAVVIVISSAIALPATIGSSAATAAVNRDGSATRPSILLIVTDDQRWDTLWAMPHVRELLAKRGTTFSDAFVVNPLCCPSRVSILTGNYSHTTGVYRETRAVRGLPVLPRRVHDRHVAPRPGVHDGLVRQVHRCVSTRRPHAATCHRAGIGGRRLSVPGTWTTS